MHSYDVVIAGAGPAGCAAAYDLAAAGRRVLLLDKRNFPRHKACACGLTRKTLKALRYSVEPVIERRCYHVVLQEAGPAFFEGARAADKSQEVHARTRAPFCAMAVRERFDHFCLQQTLAQGAEFLRVESLAAIREFRSRVEIDVAMPDGTARSFRAPVMIGADGSNGQTRRLAAGLAHADTESPGATDPRETLAASLPAEPGWYAHGFALEATVPFSDLPRQLPAGDHAHDLVFDFSPIAGGYGWLFPKGDHVNIGVGGFVPLTPGAETMNGSRLQYERATRALLATYTRAKLGVDLPAHVTGQYLGLGGHRYVPRGRVLLAGDAAGLVDPLTGEGIHSAIVSGQAAAGAILESLPAAKQASADDSAEALAMAYARRLQSLQDTLAFSHRAAASFYREPGRGFRAMRIPILRRLIVKTYADGLPQAKLITKLARTMLS